MKHIQVIDGAVNCDYHIWAATEREFKLLFPNGQDIEFAEDFSRRVGKRKASEVLSRLWTRPVNKKTVHGIHGTLFFQLLSKKPFYPTKKELEITTGLPEALRSRSRSG